MTSCHSQRDAGGRRRMTGANAVILGAVLLSAFFFVIALTLHFVVKGMAAKSDRSSVRSEVTKPPLSSDQSNVLHSNPSGGSHFPTSDLEEDDDYIEPFLEPLLSGGDNDAHVVFPTHSPSTLTPTGVPTTLAPTKYPTVEPTDQPTDPPTGYPTDSPTGSHTSASTVEPEKVTFYVLGDIPYEESEKEALERYMTRLPDDAEFVFHIGDMTVPSETNCKESAYSSVRDILLKSHAPVFITPGDNDINDCPNPSRARYHWLNNFADLEDNWRHDLDVTRQEERPENFSFFHKGTLVISVNLVGDANIFPEETAQRHADDVRFTMEMLDKYERQMVALVLVGHAKPRTSRYHADYFVPVTARVENLGKPAIYIHGDFHFYKESYIVNTNIQRLQVDIGKDAPPVQVTIRPNRSKKIQIGSSEN